MAADRYHRVTLSDNSVLAPTFTTPVNGPQDLEFELTVTDTQNPDPLLATVTDSVTIHVTNQAPIADAGPDQQATANELITLDATGSSDPDGHSLTYTWLQIAGTTVTLSNQNAAHPTFARGGRRHFGGLQLTVDDGHGLQGTDTVKIGNGNNDPTAEAGGDQTKLVSTTVTLDGTGSSDPDPNQPLSYTWTQIGGTTVTLSNVNAASPTFTAPVLPGDLQFQLTVDDGFGGTNSDTVTIHVNNHPPSANAGPNQTKLVSTLTTLNGTGSSDPDSGDAEAPQALLYSWTQLSGTTVTLSNTSVASPTFTSPVNPTTLVFQLTVDDQHGSTGIDTVTINVINHAPVANAGPDQAKKNPGVLVTLNGSGSFDNDPGQTLTYTWAQTGGLPVALSNIHAIKPTFSRNRTSRPQRIAERRLDRVHVRQRDGGTGRLQPRVAERLTRVDVDRRRSRSSVTSVETTGDWFGPALATGGVFTTVIVTLSDELEPCVSSTVSWNVNVVTSVGVVNVGEMACVFESVTDVPAVCSHVYWSPAV